MFSRLALALVGLWTATNVAWADPVLIKQLRTEPKYRADKLYTGPDTPEDGRKLTMIVNRAIDDLLGLPSPYDPARVRQRLKQLVQDVDLFATEDRDATYRYAVRLWRAAGFTDESKLFPVPDARVLAGH
jgi:hypothetical protein